MRWSVWSGLIAVLIPAAVAAGPGFRVTPEPGWVTPAWLPATPGLPVDSSQGGIETLLDDQQQNAAVEPYEIFRHVAVRVVNEQGVDGASQFHFSFDPSYQDLLLHRIRLHRGGHTTDQLDASHVRIIQRESRLEYRVYDGALTALVVLDDVRPGDIVEFSFTLRGRNPALAGHFGAAIGLAGGCPPGGFRRRLVWPTGRPLAMRHHATEVRPRIVGGSGSWEYIWLPEGQPRVESDGDLPSWYAPGPYVVLSSFQTWNEVARWGSRLFSARARPSGALQEKVDGIRSRFPLAHDQALAAIRFVQDEIRYLGIEFGESSLRPSDPDLVM